MTNRIGTETRQDVADLGFANYVEFKLSQHRRTLRRAAEFRHVGSLSAYYLERAAIVRNVLATDMVHHS